MNLEQVIKKMECKRWALTKGKKALAKGWHCTEDDIVKAKRIVQEKYNCTCNGKYRREKEDEVEKLPKVLIFDIETSPLKAYVWGRWNQDVRLEQTLSEWFLICWSAKWLYSDDVKTGCLTPEEILIEDDSRIVKELWKLFDEADIVVAHYGSRFDVPKMNTRFIVNGLNPPSSYFVIDTKKVAEKTFGFSSNKLDALATYFGIPNKYETNFDLWKGCLEGDKGCLDYMLEYNIQDVEILEEVYLRLRPYIKGHPNISNLTDKECCSNCGSEELELMKDKYYYTTVSKYQLYRCKHCGAIVRGRKNLSTAKVFTSVAK